MTRSQNKRPIHSKRVIHTVFDKSQMHRHHRNDGTRVPSTQHSVGESKQQQRGAHGGFVHAFRSPRSRTRVAPPSPHTLDKRTCGHTNPDRSTRKHKQKWEENSTQQRPHADTPRPVPGVVCRVREEVVGTPLCHTDCPLCAQQQTCSLPVALVAVSASSASLCAGGVD
ncbi:hypothetical protein TcCL_Unassigned02489 [Trypanosoma cruzi]|nr:hypothetical protein TcCL_Unassigned02489 [Trypanosoma cruzi]